MKNNFILKTIVVILVVFSLVGMASCTVSSSSMRYAEWTISEDGEALERVDIDDSVTQYTLVGEGNNLALVGELYAYESYLEGPYGEFLSPYAPDKNSNVVFLSEWDGIEVRGVVYVYAKVGAEADAADYISFFGGSSPRYSAYLVDRNKEGIFSEGELATLRAPISDPALSTELAVRDLRGRLVSEILAYSADRRLARAEGAIFKLNNEMYYVDYTALDNSYFDADGNFSYRGGTVIAERLSGAKKETVERVMGRTVSVGTKVEYEEGRYIEKEPTSVEESVLTLVILTAIVGLCIPLVPIGYVVMYALTRRKRAQAHGEGQRPLPASLWVMLAGGILWFLAALVLVIVFATV